MWFRLLNDHRVGSTRPYSGLQNIKTIKAGAPIKVELHFAKNKEVFPRYIFDSGELEHLELSELMLPERCVKDNFGNAFCATRTAFFKANLTGYGDYVARQLHYCPLCSRKLKRQTLYPEKENLKRFKEPYPPLDDSILEGMWQGRKETGDGKV